MKKFLVFFLLIACSAFSIERQPNTIYRARREALAKKAGAAVVLIFAGTEAEGPNAIYGFRQDEDFYYLSGLTDPGPVLLVSGAVESKGDTPGHPYTEILFFPAHNKVQEHWTGPRLGADTPDATGITGFAKVEELDKLADEMRSLFASGSTGVLTNTTNNPSLAWLARDNALAGRPADVRSAIGPLRMIKDEGEIGLIRHATDASAAAHLAAMKAVKPGVTEQSISALMQYEFQKRGCERPAYAPIVGSGLMSTVLHYSSNSGTMKAGDVVVMDVAGEYSMYASDITRTLPVSGHFTPRQREIYDIVLGAQQAAAAAFHAGKSNLKRDDPNSLQKVAYDYINTHGKDLHGKPLGQYFIHGLSHGIGLNVHDPTERDQPLDKGMVFSLEPGIYIPEESLGVRIEDVVWVNPEGKLVVLSDPLPRTADEVEKAMAEHP